MLKILRGNLFKQPINPLCLESSNITQLEIGTDLGDGLSYGYYGYATSDGLGFGDTYYGDGCGGTDTDY